MVRVQAKFHYFLPGDQAAPVWRTSSKNIIIINIHLEKTELYFIIINFNYMSHIAGFNIRKNASKARYHIVNNLYDFKKGNISSFSL